MWTYAWKIWYKDIFLIPAIIIYLKDIPYSRVMWKNIIWGVILLSLSGIVVASLTTDLLAGCKGACRTEYRDESTTCTNNYRICATACSDEYNACAETLKQGYDSCRMQCRELKNQDKPAIDISKCSSQCAKDYRQERKDQCTIVACRTICYEQKKSCSNTARQEYIDCNSACSAKSKVTCSNGYSAGTAFLDGCQSCECRADARISCTKSGTCNLFVNVAEEQCTGLYQRLCKGPYFRLRCSTDSYCQCDGDAGYSCPEGYYCIHDFNIKIPPTIGGYRSAVGIPLGDIGICAKVPVLANCGNSICENIVCENCPDAESSINCPQDCS